MTESSRLGASGVAAHPAPPPIDQRLRDEVLRGLLAEPRTLPPTLFSDACGAARFDRMCRLDEYYVRRVWTDARRQLWLAFLAVA